MTAQDQFLKTVSREEAIARFDAALGPIAPASEQVVLAEAFGRILASDLRAPSDVPPFDRSGVDGFAVRAADLTGAHPGAPIELSLTGEAIACGTAPQIEVTAGMASLIATGGPIPRGADAVIMVEHTETRDAHRIAVGRAALPGQFIGWAGSDMARGEMILPAQTLIGAREIGMIAACGLGDVAVLRRPKVAVLSTGDELVAPGGGLALGRIHDANGPMIAAAARENGAEAQFLGAYPDDEAQLRAAIEGALAASDMLILSGGTSKGAGDLTHRIVASLGQPGIVVHGVALKPGKPLCLAVVAGKPVVVLPGFPTSAMFTFHDIVAPVLRRMAGLARRAEQQVTVEVPTRLGSELGRDEFAMVALSQGPEGLVAWPTGKGSGAVTSFAQADGYLRIGAETDHLAAGTKTSVQLFSPHLRLPDLVIAGSHCTGLDLILSPLERAGWHLRSIAIGSLGGLQAAQRGECDLAPIHLLHPQTGTFNTPYLTPGLRLLPGWRRLQGLVYRPGDPRFEGKSAPEAIAEAAKRPDTLMVGRNQGAGTRILLDQLLAGGRPAGYWNQPKSHTAVAAAVAQGRADWGLTIAPVAAEAGLGFLPLSEEHYDFALVEARADRPAVQAFCALLSSEALHSALQKAGFTPAK